MKKKVTTQSFPEIRRKINKLIKITDEYLFTDLVRAIFCINICINNRSLIESSIALNACLYEHKNKGKNVIKNYDQFSDFFTKIYEILKPTLLDDYIVEDFGEVRFNFNNVFYRVIVGTGHNNVFACINFLPAIARLITKESELTLALEYSSNIIEYFIEDNKNDEIRKTRFVLPSSDLWIRTKHFFDEEISKYDLQKLSCLFDKNSVIEKKHFIDKNENIYPIFNTSFLIDLYDIWDKGISDDERIDVANSAILERIFSLFERDRSTKCEMYAPAKIRDKSKNDWESPIYSFVARGNNGLIIAINKDEYTAEKLDEEIRKIIKLHTLNKLEICEAYDRFDLGLLRALQIKSSFPVVFLLYDSFTNSNETNFILQEESRKIYTALDVIYFLDFIDSIDELFDYITYMEEKEFEQIFGFGGYAAFFFTRKDQQRVISKGAINYYAVDVGYDTENVNVVEYFRNDLKVYPFILGDNLFREPFAWKIQEFGVQEFEIYSKYGSGFGGRLIPLNEERYVFQSNNTEFYKGIENIEEHMNIQVLLEEVLAEGFDSLKELFLGDQIHAPSLIQLMFMPMEYAKKVKPTSFLNENRKYCYSVAINYDGNWLIKFVAKDIVKIYTDLESAIDRSTELKILEEILLPMLERNPKLKTKFDSMVLSLSKNAKMVGVVVKEIDYIWNGYYKNYTPEDYHFHTVRKRIANLCNNNGISPGFYEGKEVNKIIRSMQKSLIEDFEKRVSKFSGLGLHILLLEYYSSLLHDIHINRARYGTYQNLDPKKDTRIRRKIIEQREYSKKDARNILYLIETNLFLDKENKTQPQNDNILFLIAYANWLIVLNDVADMCHFTQNEACIMVNEDYTIDTMPLTTEEENNELLTRIYDNTGRVSRDEDVDNNYFKKVKSSFEEDMGLNFDIFMNLLTYFSSGFDNQKVQKIGVNVFSTPRNVILNDFISKFDMDIKINEANKYLDFLITDEKKLKTIKDRSDFYLPIGNKNDRENRFDIKPITSYDENIIFSPITLSNLKMDWINGMFDFMLPYKSNLISTNKTISDRKKEYERKIVYDLEKVFNEKNFELVKTNFELRKLNKAHPQGLGDYDVFAIDEANKKVWIIECKVIMLVSTFFDMYTQQNRFFKEQKEDEKFQKRINYLNNNLDIVLRELGYSNPESYEVRPYMCVNKVFMSRYKNISFPILSYSEMVDLIQRNH